MFLNFQPRRVFSAFDSAGDASGMFRPSSLTRGVYFEGESGAGSGASSQAGGNQSQADTNNNGNGGGNGQEPKTYDEATVSALRSEAADFRTKLRAAEAKVSQFETEKMSATEKLENDKKAAEAKATAAQERVIKSEVRLAAVKHKIVDPDAAYALLDKSKIKVDADGEPTNIDELIADLVKTKTYLVGQEPAAGGGSATNGATRNGGGKTLTRADVLKMTRQEIEDRWDDVQKALA